MKSIRDTYRNLRPDALLALWLGVWWVCNLVQAGLTELADDEAYYHMFAQHLAWGYFDHPPMVALLVRAGEALAGGELGVRLLFTSLQPLYLWVLWRLVRPAAATRRDAGLFAVVAAATLMLQLYGFIAVPDGPLLATSALFLLALDRFAARRRGAWLWLGLAMGAMAYSKYHGALVVLFAVAANPRLLRRPGLYAAGAVTLATLLPHLAWQADHDWASFAYHLTGRNSAFRWNYVTEFVLNMLVVFNPLFVPLYVKAWRAAEPRTAAARALKWMPPAFIGFFLLSSLRGYVQPQWTIVGALGLVYLLFDYARRHPRTRRYVVRAGLATVALVALVRLEMIFNPLGIRFEVFDNRASYGAIAEAAAGRPVVFGRNYAKAAKYSFYTGGEAYCQPNLGYRTHHWQFRDDDTRFAGGEVLVECAAEAADTTLRLADGTTFGAFVDLDFRPVRRVEIACEGLPREAAPGQKVRLRLRLTNPYGYPIPIDGETELAAVFKHGRSRVEEYPLDVRCCLPAGGETTVEATVEVPAALAGLDCRAGFALRRQRYVHWFNGASQPIKIAAR
ncbi:MAG: glycosyltransferase family 39 protein [Alistipes sp.]|nr:glycosyltransferase family 39 protein [Alistipes sp.]